MRESVFKLLAAARLGDLDVTTLGELGLGRVDAATVQRAGVAEISAELPDAIVSLISDVDPQPDQDGADADFVDRLACQPRAGVTCPGIQRLLFEPAENHAEHCAIVALYGVLLSPVYGADPETVWLASLSHHLHNAFMPDSGFSGEILLGDHLEPMMQRATALCLDQLPTTLADKVRTARRILPDVASPEGRAFHAADTLDRVWQIDQHLRPGRVTLDFVLNDMALVHAGPVKTFQDALLREAGLLS
ncbi:MAG: hypothetical protein ACRYGI_02220 [Janthinobacterium lividum]